jgi:hypothetical protein
VVTLDSLVSQQEQSAFLQDTSMIERIRAIGELLRRKPKPAQWGRSSNLRPHKHLRQR